MTMKIGIVGSHGVGKTSLLRSLCESLKRDPSSNYCPFTPLSEVARNVANSWGLTPSTIPDEYRKHYQWEVFIEQLEAEKCGGDYFISDRTVYDNLAYWNSLFWKNASRGSRALWFDGDILQAIKDEEEYYRYKRLALSSARYDILFSVKKAWELEDDGERHTDVKMQELIEKELDEILLQNVASSRVVVLQSTTTADRVEEAKVVILEKLKLFPHVLIEEPF